MKPYDDDRYQAWFHEFGTLVHEFLNTEGNSLESFRAEVENALENVEVDDETLEEKPGQ